MLLQVLWRAWLTSLYSQCCVTTGAVAGLVDQPLQSVLAQQSAEQPLSARSAAGSIMAGVGKGLMGVITKPIGGVAEFVSQTGQGITLEDSKNYQDPTASSVTRPFL